MELWSLKACSFQGKAWLVSCDSFPSIPFGCPSSSPRQTAVSSFLVQLAGARMGSEVLGHTSGFLIAEAQALAATASTPQYLEEQPLWSFCFLFFPFVPFWKPDIKGLGHSKASIYTGEFRKPPHMAREGCRLRKDMSRPHVSPSGWSPAQRRQQQTANARRRGGSDLQDYHSIRFKCPVFSRKSQGIQRNRETCLAAKTGLSRQQCDGIRSSLTFSFVVEAAVKLLKYHSRVVEVLFPSPRFAEEGSWV